MITQFCLSWTCQRGGVTFSHGVLPVQGGVTCMCTSPGVETGLPVKTVTYLENDFILKGVLPVLLVLPTAHPLPFLGGHPRLIGVLPMLLLRTHTLEEA